jgi:hypothetical protein
MRMSYRYTTTKVLMKGHKILSIILIKFVGAFVKPKGMTKICMFYWDLVVARLQINLTAVFVPHGLIKEVVDSGNHVPVPHYNFIQGLVINVKSQDPYFFWNSMIGLPKGDEMGQMCPLWSSSWIYLLISSFSNREKR